jgi:hypothetical protein
MADAAVNRPLAPRKRGFFVAKTRSPKAARVVQGAMPLFRYGLILQQAGTGKLPTLDQLTYLISRSIALNGIPPKNNLGSILEMIKQDTTLINDNVTKDLKIKVDLILKDF